MNCARIRCLLVGTQTSKVKFDTDPAPVMA